jgi:hypothetical protein
MSAFPDIIGAPSGYSRKPMFSTGLSPMGANHVVRYRKWLRERFTINLSWDSLTPDEAQTVEDFFLSTSGGAYSFDWYDWKPQHWRSVPVATGDGMTVSFNLPCKASTDQQFYVGTLQVSGTVSHGTGADGADRVTLTAPPAAGASLTVDFYGRRKFTVRLAGEAPALVSHPSTGRFGLSLTLHSVK